MTNPFRVSRLSIAAIVVFLLPAIAFGKNGIQVVVVPVANMYSRPGDNADVVSQVIYGSNVILLVSRGEWSRIQTSDHYRGWIPSRHLRIVLSGNGYGTSGPTVQVESLFANIYREPDVKRHKPVVTVPFETRLEMIPEQTETAGGKKGKSKQSPEGWLQVRLPGRTNAWIQAGDVVSNPKPLTIPESIELAKRFLGLPYLWGGTSSFGFDCSGFTQMLMRERGFNIPRQADKQAAWKGAIPVGRKDLEAGDLLFFGSSPKDITHTGIYIGDGQFIHDATDGHPGVQIVRIDDQPWSTSLVASRRVK